jgi:hypothetical protein
MAVLKNRAKMSTSTTGTGTITLGSAESGYQTFADAGVANADVVRYVIEDGSNFEIGTGTYTSSGTTLTRTVSESSNSDAAINLSGSATVFIGATAADIELSGNMAGDISSNGHEIKFADSGAADQDRLTFGASDDLQIYHDGSNSYIVEGGTGDLRLQAANLAIQNTFGQYMIEANNGGGVNLYHNTTLKAQTESAGFAVRGQLVVRDSGGGVEYRLPAADGTNGQVLTTDGSGAVTFADAGGGGGADLYAANESSPAAQPSATGANAIAIGDSAVASDEDAFAGPLSRASGTYSVALGIANNSSSYGAGGSYAVSLGYQSRAMALQSVALGAGAYVDSDSSRGFALGENSFVQQCDYGLALGAAARVHGGNSATEATAFGSSYASGTSSIAAAIANNTSSYGASGNYSLSIGQTSKTTNSNAIALGSSNTSSGVRSVTLGGEVNTASAESSYAFGVRSVADKIGQYAFGCWIGQQGGMMVLKADTTDATPKAMASNNNAAGSNNQIILPNNSAYAFHGTIVARQKAGDGTASAAWRVEGLIRREGSAGATVLVNSATTVLDNTPNWGMALSADTTNGGLAITVNGAASTNVKFVANITTSELTYA